jgi:uncharacterized OsmC-like protein
MTMELNTKVSLKQVEEMVYKGDLGSFKIEKLYIDERDVIKANKMGTSPTKLLALSVLGCLAASFSFCLQKMNFSLSDLEGKAEVTISRNKNGFWRVSRIDIEIVPKIDTPEMRKRADQCKKFFEQYCIIAESLRTGFEVNVDIKY